MVGNANRFNAHSSDEDNSSATLIGGGAPPPSRFTIYTDPSAAPESPSAARKAVNAELAKPSYKCKHEWCTWSTVVESKLKHHEDGCLRDHQEFLRGKRPGSEGEATAGVTEERVIAIVKPMLAEFAKEIVAALKPEKPAKKERKPRGSAKGVPSKAGASGSEPVPEVERTHTSLGALEEEPNSTGAAI